jgi:hypothetical protein
MYSLLFKVASVSSLMERKDRLSGCDPETDVYYSPRTAMHSGEPIRAFTAIGEILDRTIRRESQAFLPIAEMFDILVHMKRQSGRSFLFCHLPLAMPRGDSSCDAVCSQSTMTTIA